MKLEKLWKMKKMKKKTGNLLIFCALLFFCVNSIAQSVRDTAYTYFISNKKYEIIQYCIHNNTNEKMLLWLEKDSLIRKMPIKDKVKKYFFSPKGDFSLVNIINENGSTLIGVETEIFYTFYKIIKPNNTFYLYVINKFPTDKKHTTYRKMIVTVTPSQLEKVQLNIFKISGLEKFSFLPNTLTINLDDL